jgi:hypothetical protein
MSGTTKVMFMVLKSLVKKFVDSGLEVLRDYEKYDRYQEV